ncbi:MAG TPA: HAD family hydrolase [Acidimicrobiales bacterium]|nr:HAD family hydrolase [Acidimicrobiales bacterium]
MARRAVLFDWRGTLVADPEDAWWVAEALRRLGRPTAPTTVAQLVEDLEWAAGLEQIREGLVDCDCSASRHREATLAHFAAAGLDDDLALALYELDGDPVAHPFADDAAAVLTALRARGVAVAVVSDIHFDLRPEFRAVGLFDLVDAFVLSFEHGMQKPAPEFFLLALDELGVAPAEALMVGDRASHDGGAVDVGIETLLVPPLRRPGDSRLSVVLQLV